MPNLFEIDTTQLRRLEKFYKKAPRLFNKAAAYTLNDQAFTHRKYAIAQIKNTMTIRSSKFVDRNIQVEKTRITDINKLHAVYGSVERERFTGWEEQQTGKPSKRERTQTVAARRGSFANKVSPRARLKKSASHYTRSDFKGKNKTQQTASMMAQIRRGDVKRRPFIIGNGMSGRMRNLTPGLYEIKNKKLLRLQNFNPRKDAVKKNPWMTDANRKAASRVPMSLLWARNLNKVLPKSL